MSMESMQGSVAHNEEGERMNFSRNANELRARSAGRFDRLFGVIVPWRGGNGDSYVLGVNALLSYTTQELREKIQAYLNNEEDSVQDRQALDTALSGIWEQHVDEISKGDLARWNAV
mgnify:FL=1